MQEQLPSTREPSFLWLLWTQAIWCRLPHSLSSVQLVLQGTKLSLFPRSLGKVSSVGLWWVPFFIIFKLIFALYFIAQVGPPWRGCPWFERCWRNDWREWGQGNPLSEVGQFYVATFIISNFFLSFLFSWTVSSPQVLTYKLSGKSEEAKIWTEKLMFHLESIGISKEEKVKPPFSIILLQD